MGIALENKKLGAIIDCLPDKHKRRDNRFGITWCVKCGRLFTVPCGTELKETDKLYFKS